MTAKPFRLPEPDISPLTRALRLHAGVATLRLHATTGDRAQLQQAARELEVLTLGILRDERRRVVEAA